MDNDSAFIPIVIITLLLIMGFVVGVAFLNSQYKNETMYYIVNERIDIRDTIVNGADSIYIYEIEFDNLKFEKSVDIK